MKTDKTLEYISEGCALYGLTEENHLKTYRVESIKDSYFRTMYDLEIELSCKDGVGVITYGNKWCDYCFVNDQKIFTTTKGLLEDYEQRVDRRISGLYSSLNNLKREIAMLKNSPFNKIKELFWK